MDPRFTAFPEKKVETGMKLTMNDWFDRFGAGTRMRLRLELALGMALCLSWMAWGNTAGAQAVNTTTVQGTVYLANGQVGAGTLVLSWPAFTTANGQSVAADSTTVTIAADGFVSVSLAPNVGATPAGLYYTAVYYLSDGTTTTQYWVVPAAVQASLAQVQSRLMPAAQAVQAVSQSYVDQAMAELEGSLLTASGGNLTGPLFLNGDPTQPLQAATKHYVDNSSSAGVPLAGGNMTGALQTPAVNGVQSPLAGSSQTTLQAAVNAAGSSGALQIPPGYTGTDSFTNPNGLFVRDLRPTSAQQQERSVKEFGAVCDGVTDDTNALQSALNYANAHGVALTIPQGTCRTRSLSWHGESIGGMGKQVSALMGFPGLDVLASPVDSVSLLSYTRIHDLTIYVDQSVDVSCSAAQGRMPAGTCAVARLMEKTSIFSAGGNGLNGKAGTGAGWAVGNCAIAMPAATGAGGNGLRVAEMENIEIAATGVDPMAAQYPGAHSTHTCGLYLAQWPQWSEFRNIDIRGVNTGIAIPALPVTAPAGLLADSNHWQKITIQATHGFTAAAGSNNVLDNVEALAGNSAATAEPPTGLVLDLGSSQKGWTVRNAVVLSSWSAVQPELSVTAAGGAVIGVRVGAEHGLGFDPYGTQVPLQFSGNCSAQATASVNTDGSLGAITVTQAGVGCSGTTTASVNVAGTWDTAAPVNFIAGQNMMFFAGNLLKGNGGYTVWNAANSQSNGMELEGGGGNLPGGGTYPALVATTPMGAALEVDQFPGTDFGAKLQACLGALNTRYGGTCDARNFTGTLSMASNLTVATSNAAVLLPCATISTASELIVTAGTRNVSLRGCALRGGTTASGCEGGTVFQYSGTGAMVQVGDPSYAMDTQGFHMDDVVINTTLASSATAQALAAYRTQELNLENLYLLGNANQTGIALDGTGNYTGGSFLSNHISGFQTAIQAIGHQIANAATTDWLNASTFVRLHIDCPTSAGSPVAGTYGINLQQGDGNTLTGGDVEGCDTALHLGPNAQNNTIVGLRNENSNNQVVADAGSSYNNWMTGGTMFTGQLTDNGTRNSFLDTFHRSFNGMKGDWYGSQQDATVTNHYRLGIGNGNERGLLNEIQTDYGYRWLEGYTDATAGEQFFQVGDLLNNVNRISIGQYNSGQSSTNNQTVMNSAGTGAVVLNGSNNAGTGGVIFGSGGPSETTVATIGNTGNAQFNGTLQVSGTSQSAGTMTVRNNTDAEVDYYLWPGLTTSQKGSYTYKDWNGNSQWYMVKDASNNWALNSATGGLDSFKAYQNTNSGDTYVNASNPSGMVRVNYENGTGAGFNIYGGNSSSLYASFTGTSAIKFPGLAAGSGHNCLQIDNSGYITNTGAACGTGSGSGTVTSASSGQVAYYTGNGTLIGGMNQVPVSAGGTGASSAAGALVSLGAQPAVAGLAADGANGIAVAGNVAAVSVASGQVNGAIMASVCGMASAPSWCSGTEAGAWSNAAIAHAIQLNLNGTIQGYGRVTLDPNQGVYNTTTTIVVPYGIDFDCQGAVVNWVGSWGTAVGGVIHPGGPFALAGTFGNGNPRGTIRNCRIANHGAYRSQYPDTDGAEHPNYTFGILVGGDPNGLITSSALWGSNMSVEKNVISGFNAGVAAGNNFMQSDFISNYFNGNLNAYGDGTIFACGSGPTGSGELDRISGGVTGNNNGNALMLNCGGEWAAAHTSFDYSNSQGWMSALSTGYMGAPAPSNPISQAEVSGFNVNLSVSDAHLEHNSGPLVYPTGPSRFKMSGGMGSLTAFAVAGQSYYCQILDAHTAVFSLVSTGYGPIAPVGSPFQVSSSTCPGVNGVQFTSSSSVTASISSTNYINVTGTTTATLAVTAQQADTGAFTQGVTSPTYCAITNPSTGLYIADITVPNVYSNSESLIPSGFTTCSVLNGQTIRAAQNLAASPGPPPVYISTNASNVVADVSAIPGIGVVSGSETGTLSVGSDTGYLKPNHGAVGGSSTFASDGTFFSAFHAVASYCDISSDAGTCAVNNERSNGLFGGAAIQNMSSMSSDGPAVVSIKAALGVPVIGAFTGGGSGMGVLARSSGLGGTNKVSVGAGTTLSSANACTFDYNYNNGSNQYGTITCGNHVIAYFYPSGMTASAVLESVGTQAITGCSLTSNVGGSAAGSFKSGVTGTCTVTATPGVTAGHGFRCTATDMSTGANLPQTGYSTTACTFAGTTTSNDQVTWQAIAF